MPAARQSDAVALAERIQARVRDWVGELPDAALKVTATLAVAEFGPNESFEAALERADLALYRGKQEGRDRIVVASQVLHV